MLRTALPLSNLVEYTGLSGARYLPGKPAHGRPYNRERVQCATSGLEQFILKDISEREFDQFRENILPQLASTECPHLRLPCDSIIDDAGRRILVYRPATDDFLSLVKKKQLPEGKRARGRATKRILKAVLRGIAELHGRDVVHMDIRPDKIHFDCPPDSAPTIQSIQLANLESALYLPPGRRSFRGKFLGHPSWRSPEAILGAEINKPADMYSFGTLCIWAHISQDASIFAADTIPLHDGDDPWATHAVVRLQRQIGYFGDEKGMAGLIRYVGEERQGTCAFLRRLWVERSIDAGGLDWGKGDGGGRRGRSFGSW
ncbi:hypothetical protein BO70DRAFT_430137 [Aspergillus heteromorphus CBS 117.55]|uniref:Protein kinase domain-containing protein n=1 Tax=Aspergillus heteromorphus CBS 117.55 TaxID=1448321 RepID=A0A317VV82_9EURO|nr:uncharacterized protein BO70DRAFT_430137 [Aspergillus heteromorphus CBS 117.55]PWY78213.1 hypothetical protein BO70DRAFT_430137 [Aspergillus heteromorphus CBS 117.55]